MSAAEAATENPMTQIRLAKVIVNMGVGEGAERLQKAERVMQSITGAQPTRTHAKKSVRDWGVREAQAIGCKVTLRGEAAADLVKRALWVRQNRIAEWTIDSQGNCSFGITDHTDFEGQKYDPEIGVFGLDVAIVLERPGERIKRRRIGKARVPRRHRVSRDEAKAYLKENFNVEVVG